MTTKINDCPCRNCEKRNEHCHSKCEEYKGYKQERERLKKKDYMDNLVSTAKFHRKRKQNSRVVHLRNYDE